MGMTPFISCVKGALLGSTSGVASAGRTYASQQGPHHHHVILEEDVIHQHGRSLHTFQIRPFAQVLDKLREKI